MGYKGSAKVIAALQQWITAAVYSFPPL